MQEVTINTIDDVDISALLWDRRSSKNLLLLHMMPSTKESWEELAEEAYTAGYNVLAIDFRGHGKSGGGDYQAYTDEDHHKYFIDARAAMNYMEDKYLDSRTIIVGASIGANIALQIMSHDPLVEKVVCLSAGTDYYGVKAIDFVKDLDQRRKVFFIASHNDERKSGLNCAAMAKELSETCPCTSTVRLLETAGHGTDMLTAQPKLIEEILEFIK